MPLPIRDDVECPCGADRDHAACCRPILRDGAGLGTTAEQLMRARYSAYVLHDGEFLVGSWHPDTRPDAVTFDHAVSWRGLTIVATTGGGGLERAGTVEFRAGFERNGEPFELHEISSFVRLGGRWHYVDGAHPGPGPGEEAPRKSPM